MAAPQSSWPKVVGPVVLHYGGPPRRTLAKLSSRIQGCLRFLIAYKGRSHLTGSNYVGRRRETARPTEVGNRDPRPTGKGVLVKSISVHEQHAEPAGPSTLKKESLPIGASAGSGRCQVGTGTDSPCGRPAATKLLDVLFCERCAREQEDYFAIGELTQAPRGRRAVTGSLERDTNMLRSQAIVKRWRRSRRRVAKGGKVPFLLVVLVLGSVLASAACGGTEQARGESAATGAKAEQEKGAKERLRTTEAIAGGNETDRAVARAGDVVARAGGAARADDVKAGAGDAEARSGSTAVVVSGREDVYEGDVEGKDGPQKVTLRIGGDSGTRFSGACSVGGEERTLNGRAPERYAFETRGKKFECEVRKESEGALGIIFSDGDGARSVQRTDAGEGTVGFAYSSSGISSLTSSSVSVDQTVTTSGGSSSDGSP